MGLSNILKEAGFDGFTAATRPPAWDRSQDRLLVCTVDSFTLEKEDDTVKVHASVTSHNGESLTLFHTARLGYAYCNLLGLSWSTSLTVDDFGPLIGWTLVVHYNGQDTTRNDAHMFDIVAFVKMPDGKTCKEIYEDIVITMKPEDLAPIGGLEGEDSDL